eukprot:GHVU01034678.1.p2 GENE.GHVU01034678.1~~GHVU01034678.1.p2  ORF type:complete len:110 (+),score=8.92 GHVU01034678.1:126-455(+)
MRACAYAAVGCVGACPSLRAPGAWVHACTVACIAASNSLPPFSVPQRGRKSAALAALTLHRCDGLGVPMEAVVDKPKRIWPAPPEKKLHDTKAGDAEARQPAGDRERKE